MWHDSGQDKDNWTTGLRDDWTVGVLNYKTTGSLEH